MRLTSAVRESVELISPNKVEVMILEAMVAPLNGETGVLREGGLVGVEGASSSGLPAGICSSSKVRMSGKELGFRFRPTPLVFGLVSFWLLQKLQSQAANPREDQ